MGIDKPSQANKTEKALIFEAFLNALDSFGFSCDGVEGS